MRQGTEVDVDMVDVADDDFVSDTDPSSRPQVHVVKHDDACNISLAACRDMMT
jgi:hypothetical protein